MPRRPHLTLGAILLATGLAGCGYGAVDVEPHEPEPGSADVCTALQDALPDTVDDAVRRDVDPSSEYVAAWGQPPIVLRCGVPMPASYRPDAQLFDVDGVGWLADEGEGGIFFTAVDREILVEVAVPDDYAPEANVLADLATAILDTVPERALR
ncbi:DUF3515 domain-containing protein [Jiangella aurantiaca]|uniref:DUF3515 domain-containing protein n=1 Tax=Jiangella aurantiaca TaxID=2530373 RepID=A0A4R5A8H1_9ACTN|nr:DUF3515 domain-containing protein [Jiangella aurantiaca]TDD65962.1 DUF3515 domain-containing protein [Jiangella aurantiaca]